MDQNPTAGEQRWDPERYRRWAPYVPELGRGVLDLLDPRPGERVLDLGCGDGELTEQLAARGCRVLGVDRSAEFVAAARQRGLSAQEADARHLAGPELAAGSFDAVFSNAVLHWIPEAAAVIAGVRRLLRPGGRFVAEFGGAGNIAAVRDALSTKPCAAAASTRPPAIPGTSPRTASTGACLEAHGFEVTEHPLVPAPHAGAGLAHRVDAHLRGVVPGPPGPASAAAGRGGGLSRRRSRPARRRRRVDGRLYAAALSCRPALTGQPRTRLMYSAAPACSQPPTPVSTKRTPWSM